MSTGQSLHVAMAQAIYEELGKPSDWPGIDQSGMEKILAIARTPGHPPTPKPPMLDAVGLLERMGTAMKQLEDKPTATTWLLMSPHGEVFMGTAMDMMRILALKHDPLDRLTRPEPSTTPASHPYRRTSDFGPEGQGL